jgi:Mycothiol maleylpyruvate isomerase N-terminal domain
MTDARVAAGAFLLAGRHAEAVLGDHRVGSAWDSPSALPRMDVGAVAGHLFLVVRRVDKHLDRAQPPVSPVTSDTYPTVSVARPDDLDLEVHRRVRRDGRHVAAWGWSAVVDALGQRLVKLDSRLTAPLPSAIAFGDRSIDFGEYLASRVVEVLVHTDDLAASVGLDDVRPPPPAVDAALAFLVAAARRSHGDLAVLRAFTRRERIDDSVPFVY